MLRGPISNVALQVFRNSRGSRVPGQFFEKESQVTLAICGCVIARDESDHSTESKHWETSVYVKQCSAHKDAASTPAQCHTHAMSQSVAVNVIMDKLPITSFVPILKGDAIPTIISGPAGRIFQFTDADIARVQPIVPIEAVLSPKQGQICVRHPDLDATIAQAVTDALAKHKYADLTLADDMITADVFVAVDAFVSAAPKGEPIKPLMFDVKGGVVEIKSTTIAAVAEAVDVAIVSG